MVKIYTNPNCVQCEQTKKFLDKASIPYETIDLMSDPESAKRFIEMGFRSAPIVETSNDIWSGFKYDKLRSLEIESNR